LGQKRNQEQINDQQRGESMEKRLYRSKDERMIWGEKIMAVPLDAIRAITMHSAKI